MLVLTKKLGVRSTHDAARECPGPTSLPQVLADPRVRLCAGVAALLATASAARRDRVGPWEAGAFRAINGLPDSWHLPAWVVMQLGTFGAVPAAATVAWLAGDGELAGRLAGLTRIYVGAHLPLDVAGGAALGLAVEATVELVTSSDPG